jgi:hypothetical protein
MVGVKKLRQAIRSVLDEYAALPRRDLTSHIIWDEKNDRYLLMAFGWRGVRQYHYCVAHLEIVDGKIWIHRDGTEEGLAVELERYGIPKSKIVLGFHEPEARPYTEYAAA